MTEEILEATLREALEDERPAWMFLPQPSSQLRAAT